MKIIITYIYIYFIYKCKKQLGGKSEKNMELKNTNNLSHINIYLHLA